MAEADATNVRVAVRFRPFNAREKSLNDTDCITVTGNQVCLNANVAGNENKNFAFDFVFQENSLQTEVWDAIGDPILAKAFSGYNGTIFAYGQTGSGKTWSMQGGSSEELRGIIPRMTRAVFQQIDQMKEKTPSLQFLVTASYFELYNEVIFDLLDSSDRRKRSKGGLEIKEHPVLGVYVKNLQEVVIDSSSKMQALIDSGMSNRTTASTQMNAESSRSHSVFTFKLHQKDLQDESKNLFAKVNLVDLAGSERQKSTGAVGATLKEGANINKSLSALGNVINALVEQSKGKKGVFIPYRNSKLTRVLQESLGGNSITIMVAAMSRALLSADETLSTLKYADRAKAIKVKAVKNDESSQISRLEDEIRALKEKLMSQEAGGGGASSGGARHEVADVSEIEERHRQQLKDLEDAMKNTWEEKARISEGYEADRLRLQTEQMEATRQLSRQVQEKWQVLEDKKDMDLTITHVKESSKAYLPEAFPSIESWQLRLRDFLRQEAELAEQDTVVTVYRSSLSKDENAIMRTGCAAESPVKRSDTTTDQDRVGELHVDKSTISVWKQLKDRLRVLDVEANKWMHMQDTLIGAISNLKDGVSEDIERLGQMQPQTDSDRVLDQYAEMTRGFDIISRQLIEKEMELHGSIAKSRCSSLTFNETASQVLAALQQYEKALQSNVVDQDGDVFNTAADEASKGLVADIQKSSIEIYDHFDGKESTPTMAEATSALASEGVTIPADQQDEFRSSLPNGFTMEESSGDIEQTVLALGQVLDWAVLLKKNAPEKLLKRPPVRFLYDVLRTLCATCNLSIVSGGGNACPAWEDISSTRDNKLSFIREAISQICSAVQAPAPVEAESVIAGENSDKVNILLQYVAVAAFNALCRMEKSASSQPISVTPTITTKGAISDSMKSSAEGTAALHILTNGVSVIQRTLEYLVAMKDQIRKKKEDLMKKLMDGLADEKRQLEERLVKEQNMMKSESLGLSEQLSACQRKLSETEGLLSTEANMRAQLQELSQRAEMEKRDLQEQLQNQLEENDSLKTAQLALQSKSQKETILLENLRKKVDEQVSRIRTLEAEADSVRSGQQDLEAEKEELMNQVSVLSEERDAARNNEQDFFETLTERCNDLDKLQESYVDMTDRCNDYMDELSDLREKVEMLEELLQNARALAQPVTLSASRSEAVMSPRAAESSYSDSSKPSSRRPSSKRDSVNRASYSSPATVEEAAAEVLVSSDDCGVRDSPNSKPSATVLHPSSAPTEDVAEGVMAEQDKYYHSEADRFDEPEDDYGDDEFND